MGDRCGVSISADIPLDETLSRGPMALLLRRQYEFPFGINIVQFSIFNACYVCMYMYVLTSIHQKVCMCVYILVCSHLPMNKEKFIRIQPPHPILPN